MLGKQFRRSETLLIFEVIGNNGLSGPQRVTAGRSRSAPTVAEPTTPSSQPTPARTRSRFSAGIYSRTLQYSASQSLGCNASSVLEHVHKSRTLQRKDAELREQFLLPNALPKSAARQALKTVVARRRLNNRFSVVR